MAENYIKINSGDNVAVALEKLSAGETAAANRGPRGGANACGRAMALPYELRQTIDQTG